MSAKHASAVATDATSPTPVASPPPGEVPVDALPSRRALRAQQQASQAAGRHATASSPADVPRGSAVPTPPVPDVPISPYFSPAHFEAAGASTKAHIVQGRSGGTYATQLRTTGATAATPTVTPQPTATRAELRRSQRVGLTGAGLPPKPVLPDSPSLGADTAAGAGTGTGTGTGSLPSRKQLRVEQLPPTRAKQPTAGAAMQRGPRLVISSPGSRPAQHCSAKPRPTYTRTVQVTSLAAGLAIVAGSGYALKASAEQRTEQAVQGQQIALAALDSALSTVETSDQIVQAETERELQRSNDVSRQLQETAIRQSQAIEVASQALSNGERALERSKDVLSSTELESLGAQVDQLKASIDSGDISEMVELAQQVSTGAGDVTEAMKHLDKSMNGRLPDSYLCDISFAPGYRLRCDAAEALERLNEAYKADFGTDMIVSSAYRSYGEQAAVRSSRGAWAVAPGTSQHGWGVAVDFSSRTIPGYGSKVDAWLLEHGPDYGWYRPEGFVPGSKLSWAKPEYWHWEFGQDLWKQYTTGYDTDD